MRDNFERFRRFICLDMMKFGITKLLWPYVIVEMYNYLKEICIGYEGIILVERIEGYEFVLHFMFNQTPARSKKKVYIVSGDRIFDELAI